ncbi:MAG: biotin/lipoyl-binding protein [Bacteroidetes bacterium]|nr:biotin/lipoyl-binding protein [Bacteroidota bacterium]
MYKIQVNGTELEVRTEEGKIWVDGEAQDLEFRRDSMGRLQVRSPHSVGYAEVIGTDGPKHFTLKVKGGRYDVALKDRYDMLLEQLGMDKAMGSGQLDIKAPMPGLVLEIMVEPGIKVEKGTALLVLEAMKMENVLKAPGPGTVKEVRVKTRQAVEKGTVLLVLE